MSVKVDLNELAGKFAEYPFGYLITVGDDYHAHTVAVEPRLVDGVIDVGPVGGHTRSNIASHPNVTVVCPPRQSGDYSLIIDGEGRAGADDESQQIVPSRAVLHRRRSAPPAGATSAAINDCVVLSEN